MIDQSRAIARIRLRRPIGVVPASLMSAASAHGRDHRAVEHPKRAIDGHRANHRIGILWRFHRVHHSDSSFTVSTALRVHPGELLMSLPLRLAAIAAIGAPVVAVAAFEVVFMIANLFEHGNIDLPLALERRIARLTITPALHRLHHSRRRMDLDSNFGTALSFRDRLFGTYRASSSRTRIEVGLSDTPSPPSLVAALRLPFVG